MGKLSGKTVTPLYLKSSIVYLSTLYPCIDVLVPKICFFERVPQRSCLTKWKWRRKLCNFLHYGKKSMKKIVQHCSLQLFFVCSLVCTQVCLCWPISIRVNWTLLFCMRLHKSMVLFVPSSLHFVGISFISVLLSSLSFLRKSVFLAFYWTYLDYEAL